MAFGAGLDVFGDGIALRGRAAAADGRR